ncbi:glycoside hydrolase family 2 TIM barrel-domain containing protein [Anaerorhabdus sp.]|uniref:glycoside hydrolase family 2 TIM barrel-domain containing protein n=2 Tax=Anaerorhabdus sp. TaxID=1872524 RepID=UPI002FCB8C25
MRKIIASLCVLLVLSGCSKQSSQFVEPESTPRPSIEPLETDNSFISEEWYDRFEIFEENRENAHASFTPYSSKKEALKIEKTSLDDLDKYASPYIQSLNGTWKFYYASKPGLRLKNIAGLDAFSYWEEWDTQLNDEIQVPSNIQTIKNSDGTFKYETPIYINQIYPWLNYENIQWGWQNVPVAPTAFNSVSHYKRDFELNDSMKDRNIFIRFEGVESAYYLYINGQRVGYSEDSYTTSEFNITSYLKEGKNTIAVEVYRWSTGSYFENQDFIRMNGIFRDVYLVSKDDVELRDVFISNTCNDDYTEATLNIESAIRNLTNEDKHNYSLSFDVFEQNKEQSVLKEPIIVNITDLAKYGEIKDTGAIINQEIKIDNPLLWSSDKPNLYRVVVELFDENNKLIETTCIRTGIRNIEIKEIDGISQIQLNGKKIMLKGVNRHETSLENGRSITKDEILKDLQIMKSYNINSFRMSHYPNQTVTYDLADELGLYIVDEANIESHIGEKELSVPGNNPMYIPLILDRTMNMVERDKNHASILFWSLGNESTYAEYPMDENYPFYVSSQWVLDRDPSRLRVYERDNRINGTRKESIVDVVSSQYWTVDQINEYGQEETNAFFQSEYAHAMGNALGNYPEYYELYRKYPNVQGGFIWDFIDQSVLTSDAQGNTFFGNGYDWNTPLTDGDFCGNGIVSANRVPQAEIEEVKKVNQDFLFTLDNNKLSITSESISSNLNEYKVEIQYFEEGKLKDSEILTDIQCDLEPLSKKEIFIHIPKINDTVKDAYLNVYVSYKNNQNWANEYGGKKGDVLAKEQFILKETFPELSINRDKSVAVEEDDSEVMISGEHFEVKFNKITGTINNYTYKNEILLVEGLLPSFYRAPVSNDLEFTEEIKNASTTFVPNKISVNNDGKIVEIHCDGLVKSTNTNYSINYTIDGDGNILVESNIDVPSIKSVNEIARVGLEMKLGSTVKKYEMFGKGPFENYVDRNTAAFLGVYSGNIKDSFNNTYLVPQDSGNKTGVKYLVVKGKKNHLTFKSNVDLAINILPYEDSKIEDADHYYQLVELDTPILHLDLEQRGLGNASWGAEPLDKYKVNQNQTVIMKVLISPK